MMDKLCADILLNLAGFQSIYYRSLLFTCRNYQTQGLDSDLVLKLQYTFIPLKVVATEAMRVSSSLLPYLGSRSNSSWQTEIGDFLYAMRREPSYRRLVILGAPGTGKTTLLRYLALSFVTNNYRSLHPKTPKLIPVIIYFKDIYKNITQQDSSVELEELIEQQVRKLPSNEELNPPSGWFAQKLRQGRCLVMFDGLDEIVDEDQRSVK
jgi:predicted NACHT family NTPase